MMNRILSIFLLIGLCAVANAQESSVVVLLDSISVSVGNLDSYSYVRHRKFILKNQKASSLADVVIGVDDNTELSKFEYVMTDLSGKVLRTVKKSELKPVEYSHELATDFYRLIAEVTPPQYPVIITRTEKIVCTANAMTYPSFYPQNGYDMAVKKAVYQISYPKDKVCIRQYKSPNVAIKPSIQQVGKNQVIRYEFNDLKPVTRMPYAPYLDDLTPYMLFAPEKISYYGTTGSMASWTSFGKWQYDLAVDRDLIPDSYLQPLREQLSDCHTDREKIVKVCNFVDKNTRYVSLQLGIGGYQPATAFSVSHMGCGDCKGLSIFMHGILKSIGIDSRLVAIGTDEPDLLHYYPNVNQLNHMILAVLLEQGRDTVWLECTNSKLPVGYIHDDISGHDALLLDADKSRLVKLPEYADSLNLRSSNICIKLRHDASADVSIDETFRNHQYGANLGLLKKKEQDLRTSISSWYKLPNTSFGSITVNDVSKPFDIPQLNTHLDGVCAKYANLTGKRLFVPVNPSHQDFSPIVISDDITSDRLPLKIRQGYRNVENIVINIPAGRVVESLPSSVDVKEEFGSFHQSFMQEEGIIRVTLTLDIHRGTYAPHLRKRLLEMQKKMQKAYNSRIVLVWK